MCLAGAKLFGFLLRSVLNRMRHRGEAEAAPLKVDRSQTRGCLIRSLETLISWTMQITNYNEEPHCAMADSTGHVCTSEQPAQEKSLSRLLPPIPTAHKCVSVSFDFAQFLNEWDLGRGKKKVQISEHSSVGFAAPNRLGLISHSKQIALFWSAWAKASALFVNIARTCHWWKGTNGSSAIFFFLLTTLEMFFHGRAESLHAKRSVGNKTWQTRVCMLWHVECSWCLNFRRRAVGTHKALGETRLQLICGRRFTVK